MIRGRAILAAAAATGFALATGIGASGSAIAQDSGFVVPESLANVPESADPIKVPLWEWTGHHVTQRIAGAVLERMGYTVEYVPAAEIPSVDAIQQGDLHFSLEYWTGQNKEKFFKATQQDGGAEDLGLTGIQAVEGWWYPAYVAEKCPGLPDWSALNDCAAVFAIPETQPKGRFVDFPAEWVAHNDERIASLGLDYQIINSGGEESIVNEIKSAFARQAPLLVMMWSPHWIFSQYDLKVVQLPRYEKACEDDPAWGGNATAIWDCAHPIQEIKKFAWKGFREKYPAGYRLLRSYQISNDVQNGLVHAIDVEGMPEDDVVTQWVDANEALWSQWVHDALMNPGK